MIDFLRSGADAIREGDANQLSAGAREGEVCVHVGIMTTISARDYDRSVGTNTRGSPGERKGVQTAER